MVSSVCSVPSSSTQSLNWNRTVESPQKRTKCFFLCPWATVPLPSSGAGAPSLAAVLRKVKADRPAFSASALAFASAFAAASSAFFASADSF